MFFLKTNKNKGERPCRIAFQEEDEEEATRDLVAAVDLLAPHDIDGLAAKDTND